MSEIGSYTIIEELSKNNLGITYQTMDEFDLALTQYQKTIEVDPLYYLGFSNAGCSKDKRVSAVSLLQ